MSEGDLSEFEGPTRKCPVERALDELNDEDRPKFVLALATPRISHRKIVERFHARDIPICRESIAAHRSGTCCD